MLMYNEKNGVYFLAEVDADGSLRRTSLGTTDREKLLRSAKMPLNSGHFNITKIRRRIEDRLRKENGGLFMAAKALGVSIIPEP